MKSIFRFIYRIPLPIRVIIEILSIFLLGMSFLIHPHDPRARSEISSLYTLMHLYIGQKDFKKSVVIDQDNDGIGEYGFLSELALHNKKRFVDDSDSTPYLQQNTGKVDFNGVSRRCHYHYCIYFPNANGAPLNESYDSLNNLKFESVKNINLHEDNFIVYAWPALSDRPGRYTYAMNSYGEIYRIRYCPKDVSGRLPWDTFAYVDKKSNQLEISIDKISAYEHKRVVWSKNYQFDYQYE